MGDGQNRNRGPVRPIGSGPGMDVDSVIVGSGYRFGSVGERFDARYGDALAALRGLRERLLSRGARDEWERVADELLGADFTRRVEDGSLAREAGDRR